jgi:DNA-binding transcriptional ArsR family regulator
MSTHELTEAPVQQRQYWYPEREDITIYGILAALSDPTRLEIVRNLARREECCPFDFLDMTSKQNLTHHFKVLREAGLIKSRYEGRNKYVWLRRDDIDQLFPGLLDGLLKAVAHSDPR